MPFKSSGISEAALANSSPMKMLCTPTWRFDALTTAGLVPVASLKASAIVPAATRNALTTPDPSFSPTTIWQDGDKTAANSNDAMMFIGFPHFSGGSSSSRTSENHAVPFALRMRRLTYDLYLTFVSGLVVNSKHWNIQSLEPV
jgi:hypothetical protein